LRKNRFLELFLERPRAEITRTFQGLPWDSWKYLLSEVAKMDFGCDFREGKCIAARLPGFTGQAFPPSTRRCCCVHCGKMIGYLTSIPKNDLPLLAMYFSPKYGFWRGNYGCVFRPRIVLTFVCVLRVSRPEGIDQISLRGTHICCLGYATRKNLRVGIVHGLRKGILRQR